MSTATKLITAEEFFEMDFDVPVELVRGEIVYLYGEDGMTCPGLNHGGVCWNLSFSIGAWTKATRLGRGVSNDSWITTARGPDSVRGADVAYYRMQTLPGGKLPKGPHSLIPALCVEVLSPSNTHAHMQEKVDEYLAAGTEEVWVVDPELQTVTMHRSDAPPARFNRKATLTSRVLPGYAAPVAEYFDGIET